MNWNKIINIFIILFLIINLSIFYINHHKNEQQYVLSEERISQLREILNENGFALYTYIPDAYPMKKIVLYSPKNNQEKIVENIFKEETVDIKFYDNSEKYLTETEEIEFLKGDQKGVILYKGKNNEYIPKDNTKEEYVNVGKKFAKDITLGLPKLKLTQTSIYGDYTLLEFNELYKDNLLFCNYVKIKINENGIFEASAIRYPPEKLTGRKQKVYLVDEVLYNFIQTTSLEKDELISIKDLDIGYDLGKSFLAENVLTEAIPYYRIRLHNGDVYYINAYTNELRITE